MNDIEPPVVDNVEERRFEVAVGDATASLTYTRGSAVLALVTTSIPEALRGTGVAGRLARYAMDAARAEGLKVDPSCPFMIGWLARHPEFADLVYTQAGPAADEPFWF
ncbi:MAG: GNAT family N-acetyltransferase [Gemmatimonadota bacterium]